jgi:serine/threonine protein kinase
VVVQAGDRNLKSALLNEYFAGIDGRLVRQYTKEIFAAVAHLHGHGLVHCDIKRK